MREGETIPLSDSDEEADSDTESLDGVSRQADMFLLNQALSQYGIRNDVVRIAAGMIKVKKGTVLTAISKVMLWTRQLLHASYLVCSW